MILQTKHTFFSPIRIPVRWPIYRYFFLACQSSVHASNSTIFLSVQPMFHMSVIEYDLGVVPFALRIHLSSWIYPASASRNLRLISATLPMAPGSSARRSIDTPALLRKEQRIGDALPRGTTYRYCPPLDNFQSQESSKFSYSLSVTM